MIIAFLYRIWILNPSKEKRIQIQIQIQVQVQIQIQIVYNDLELFISDNTHKLVLSMDPEAGFVEQEQRKFEDLEHKLRANLTQEEK